MPTAHLFHQRLLGVALSTTLLVAVGCQSNHVDSPAPQPADPAAAQPSSNIQSLFDGKTLGQWTPTDFGGGAEVEIVDGSIVLPMGYDMTGITWTGDVVRMNYEISLEAKRAMGGDFFCGLTFPVGDDACSLIIGGWGGSVVGLSSLDNLDAANNDTTHYQRFENDRWYRIRLRVTPGRIAAWIDDNKVVDVDTTDRQISIRNEVHPSLPLGIATWRTTGVIRDIQLTVLE